MSNFSGAIQRPLVAAAAVAVASFSAEFSDKLPSNGSSSSSSDCSTSNLAHSTVGNYLQELDSSWVSRISVSKLSDLNFVTKVPVHVPDVRYHRVPSLGHNLYHSSFASSPLFQNLYQSADLLRVPRPSVYSNGFSASTSEVSYKWHLPQPSALGGSNGSSEKPKKTVVVLLGWLGAKQRHLRKYAEWYTSKGFHVVTFTFPMDEVLRYKPGGKAEQNVELLADHLADWLEGENEKNMIFHTFSNTGWLIYGVILEHLEKQNQSVMERIKGCIVDSAPVAYPDPEVWASGFSAAFLKKNSVAAKGHVISNESGIKVSISKPAPSEAALLLVLKKCFQVILNLPTVNRRLSDVMSMLSSKQPNCPQLYMYSSADRVIPCDSVESFVEAQRKAGHDVRACNFVSSPHVDHFRNDPKLYTSQISQFLEDCLLPNNNWFPSAPMASTSIHAGSGSKLCINDALTDDELRSIPVKLEDERDKEIFGLVCKRWLRLQSTERKKLAARAGPHMLRRMADRFTRLLELDLAQSVSRSFYPGVTDSDLAVIANGFTCLRVLNLHNCKGITDVGMKAIGDGLSLLQSLDVSYCRKLTDKGLTAVAKGCSDLRVFHLAGCRFVTDGILEALSKNCRNLEQLGLQGCTNITDNGLISLASGCKRITFLDINKCSNVSDVGVSSVSRACSSSLKTLKLLDCYKIGDEIILSLSKFCDNLETLIIGGCRDVSNDAIKSLATACGSNLKNLRMDWCLNVSDSSLSCILSRCRNLEALDIGCCEEVTDAAFELISSEDPDLRLKILKVSNCPKITVAGIGILAGKCTYLEYLDVRSCPHITMAGMDEAGFHLPESCKVNFNGSVNEPLVLL